MGIFHYARHFGLLVCVTAVLAATNRLGPAVGVVAAFGIYGALHASMLAVTLRTRQSAARRLRFVAIAASLSMASVALSLGAGRFIGGSMARVQIAVLFCCSSGFGAATYAGLIRRLFATRLPLSAIVTVVLGCVVATLAVLASGIYLKNSGLWVAVSWWFALSLGLWLHDGRRGTPGLASEPRRWDHPTGRPDGAMVSENRSDGGCTCGFLRYGMNGGPLFVHCCHCRWCQRETGTAFAHNALIEADRVVLVRGRVEVIDTPSASGKGQRISRCPQCHIAVWSNYSGAGDSLHFLRVGTLDDPDSWPPDIHIHTASKQPWVMLPPGIPAVPAYYQASEHWPPASLQRREALRAKSRGERT